MKAKSNAAKLADKRRSAMTRAGLPELASIPKRSKQHRAAGKFAKREEDASIPALQARCRHAGITTTESDMHHMRAQWQGCEAGKAMSKHVADPADRAKLWDAIQHMRQTVLAYDRALGAPNRHAQCANLMLPPEPMEADAASPAPDMRTDEERYRQAISGWMAMHGWLGHVEAHALSVAIRTVVDDQRCTDVDALVRALHCVADGMAGRKIVGRGLK